MKDRPSRIGAVRHISAIGAGVLLAATPHCGGKSEGKSEDTSDDSGGGTQPHRGGASGSAGYGGFVGVPYGGYGGSYGGSIGTGGTGAGGSAGYGGFVGVPAGGSGGCYAETRCFTQQELFGCLVGDGGIDAGLPDTGIGGTDGTGEGGMAGEANAAEPEAAPRTIIREAGIAQPPPFACPAGASFPACVTPTTPLPPGNVISVIGWNGAGCCYTFSASCF